MFRKLIAFEGDFDTFFYFDSDVLVFDDLRPLLGRIQEQRCLAYYDDRTVLDWVYPDKSFAEMMVLRHDTVGFNAGAFGCVRDCFDRARLTELAKEALLHRENFWQGGLDQVFINWVMDLTGVPKVILSDLMGEQVECAAMPGLRIPSTWMEEPSRYLKDQTWIPFVHYAGYSMGLDMPMLPVWRYYRGDGPATWWRLLRSSLLPEELKRRLRTVIRRPNAP
jgi:hypothetical protein